MWLIGVFFCLLGVIDTWQPFKVAALPSPSLGAPERIDLERRLIDAPNTINETGDSTSARVWNGNIVSDISGTQNTTVGQTRGANNSVGPFDPTFMQSRQYTLELADYSYVSTSLFSQVESFAKDLNYYANRQFTGRRAKREDLFPWNLFDWSTPAAQGEMRMTWYIRGKDNDQGALTYGMVMDSVAMFTLWLKLWDKDQQIPSCELVVVADFMGPRRPLHQVATGSFVIEQ